MQVRSIEYSETKSNIDRPWTSATVLGRTMTDKSKILCDLLPKTNTEEVPNEEVPTRYLAAVPMSKFLLWEIVIPAHESAIIQLIRRRVLFFGPSSS
jgi:hypothetical protein